MLRTASLPAVLALALAAPTAAVPATPRTPLAAALEPVEQPSLRTIDAWLKASGREGYLAADVADAAGIARGEDEQTLGVSQRGFRSGDVLRIAQRSSDGRREFLLFMVQRPGGEVVFYLSTVRDGLRKAFVSLPESRTVLALDGPVAIEGFRAELDYWEARIAGL